MSMIKYKKFKDYMTERELREEEDRIQVNPVAQKKQLMAFGQVVAHEKQPLPDVNKNALVGRVAIKAAKAGVKPNAFSARSTLDMIDPAAGANV